jgi:hypothetical protein
MNFKALIKNSADSLLNITKEPLSKAFDFTKIQSENLKNSIDAKIQEKAVLNLKAELTMRHKTFDDYNDEELEIMLSNEKSEIFDSLKSKSLIGVLALLGLDFLV